MGPSRRGQASNVFLVPVPRTLCGSTFQKLFDEWACMSDPVLALGLYRVIPNLSQPTAEEGKRLERKVENLRYVLSCPNQWTVLSTDDWVYVLAPIEWGKATLSDHGTIDLDPHGKPTWLQHVNKELQKDNFKNGSTGDQIS